MRARVFALSVAAACLAVAAHAADLPNLPTQAADPGLTNLGWKGWSFGFGVSAVAAKGARGQFGGDTFVGYDHRFANDVALSARFDAGYAPSLWAGVKGFDYVSVTTKTTLNASSPVRPFFITQGAVARGLTFVNGDPLNPFSAVNGALGGPGPSQKLGAVGAGVAVDLSPDIHLEVGARVGSGALWQPPF